MPIHKLLLLAVTFAALAGCGGGSSPTPTPTPTPTNSAPTISGTPATTALANSLYQFQPTALDADQDNLTFSAENLPSWLTIDTSTGRLFGTPDNTTDTHYPQISVHVSDGVLSASLAPFNLQVLATTPLALNGIATDAPLVNARVRLAIDGRHYEAVTDSAGAFTLNALLLLSETTREQPLVLEVYGGGNQAGAHLISLLPSPKLLVPMASTGQPLAPANLPELRITHVTTAQYLLARQLNGGQLPASSEHYDFLVSKLEVSEQEELQSAIKLMLDNANYGIGATDLIALLQGHSDGPIAAFKQWLAARSLLDATGAYLPQVANDLAAAQVQTRLDANQNLNLSASQVLGDLWLHKVGHPALPAAGGRYLRLADDGSGMTDYHAHRQSTFANALSNITWTLSDGALVLQGTNASRYEKRYLTEVGGSASEFAQRVGLHLDFAQHLTEKYAHLQEHPVDVRLVNATLEVTARTRQGTFVKQTSTLRYRLYAEQAALYNWPEADVSEPFVEVQYFKLVNTTSSPSSSMQAHIHANEAWVLPFEAELPVNIDGTMANVIFHEHFQFHADGTATARRLGRTLQWSISDQALTLIDQYSLHIYTVIAASDQLLAVKVKGSRAGIFAFSGVAWATQDKDHDNAFTNVAQGEIPGYWQTGMPLVDSRNLSPSKDVNITGFFGWTYLADGRIVVGQPNLESAKCLDTTQRCIDYTSISNRTWALDNGVLTQSYPRGSAQLTRPWEVMSHGNNFTVIYESLTLDDASQGLHYLPLAPRLNPVFQANYPAALWANTVQ